MSLVRPRPTAPAMIIAQITDLHISRIGGAPDRRFDTAAHLERCVEHLNTFPAKLDLVVATGDLVDEGTEEEYHRLRGLLDPLAAPYLLVPGNHDNRRALCTVFADHSYLPGGAPFLQYVIEDHPLRLIALDTLVPGEIFGALSADRLEWLEARLEEAPDRPTVILMHHPPFLSGLTHLDRNAEGFGLLGADALGTIVARFPNIERILCGHLHRPIQVRWHGTVALTAPATAHQFALALGEDTIAAVMEPPACLIHYWSTEAGLVSHTSYIGSFTTPPPA